MTLSSSNGTLRTIEDMRKAWSLLQECYLRIQEINDESYNQNSPVQFDHITCPELLNLIYNINDITKKIQKMIS